MCTQKKKNAAPFEDGKNNNSACMPITKPSWNNKVTM